MNLGDCLKTMEALRGNSYGGVYGRKECDGSNVVNGLDRLVKETTIFWDYRKEMEKGSWSWNVFVMNVCFLEN